MATNNNETYRVTITKGDHAAFRMWCLQHKTSTSAVLGDYIRRKIKSNSVAPVAEMHESEDSQP